MMDDRQLHTSCVRAWMERAATGLTSERLIATFEQAFDTLWRRANQTLGDVTLTAIADRVLHNAKAMHPILAPLELGAGGLRWRDVHARAGTKPDAELVEAITFVLVEFLGVVGNLTAEILTPSLHAALSSMERANERGEQREHRAREHPSGENTKS